MGKAPPKLVNPRRVKRILERIECKTEFLDDLLSCLNTAHATGNVKIVSECLDSWEATAEVDCQPEAKQQLLEALDFFKTSGISND